MRITDKIACAPEKVKSAYAELLEERKKYRSEVLKTWWSSLSTEQRAEQARKIRIGRKRPTKRDRPGHTRGETHHLSKLTEDQVREINFSMETADALAARFSVRADAIRNIWRGDTWQHLNLPRIKHHDRRTKPEHEKKNKPNGEPRVSKELKEEILANPHEDTRKLAERLGLHWFDVATVRLNHNGGYNRLRENRKW